MAVYAGTAQRAAASQHEGMSKATDRFSWTRPVRHTDALGLRPRVPAPQPRPRPRPIPRPSPRTRLAAVMAALAGGGPVSKRTGAEAPVRGASSCSSTTSSSTAAGDYEDRGQGLPRPLAPNYCYLVPPYLVPSYFPPIISDRTTPSQGASS
jgi:hypothetical protein